MVQFNFTYDANVSIEQRIGFQMAAAIWSSFLTDDIEVNLHIGATDRLDNGNAVGGAIPIFHNQTYGVFGEYYEKDISSSADDQADESLQSGNTVDLSVNGELVSGNTEILLTSAQAKALGMDQAVTLSNGTTWDRNLLNPDALDGYIVTNTSFDWSYDFSRSGEATEGTLDFLSMALHEIGHNLGFVSGLDGTIDFETLHSGKNQVSDFTALDLFRHTVDTAEIENPDGSVSNVSIGGNAYFSIDGGITNLGDFSTGQDKENGGDGFQASHWKRLQNAMGIMDPTLAYKERLSLSELDLQAMDVLGYDINYDVLNTGLDFSTLLLQAEQSVAEDLGFDSSVLTANREGSLYTMGYGQWWQIFEQQMLEMGYGQWWQILEAGYEQWKQQQDDPTQMLEMGYGQWWQAFEDQLLEMGYGQWWQEFEQDMLQMGYGQWWQVFEMGYGQWWQKLETYFSTLDGVDGVDAQETGGETIDQSGSETSVVVSGGDADDILAGSSFRDLMSGGGGDDLIDGKEGSDNILGEAGNDILYGWDGDDKLYGGTGDDFVSGEAGNDKLYGEEGADILAGGFGNDLLDGGEGKDLLKGDAGSDVLDGGEGNDDVDGGEGNDIVIGGSGEDIVSGSRGDDVLYGDDYIAAVDTDEPISLEELSELAGFITAVEKPPIDFWVRLEAEDFKLKNFNVEEQAIASGNNIISTGGRGEAKTSFSGPTGIYDIIVGYYDEKDGKGDLELEVGSKKDEQKFEWILDQDFKLDTIGIENFTTYTIRGIELEAGKEIKIKGKADKEEFIRLDYIDIVSSTKDTAFAEAQFYNGSFYLESKTKTYTEAAVLGGDFIKEVEKESAEGYWLNNALGTYKDVIKVDVSSSQFNLVLDEATLSSDMLRIEAESFDLSGDYKVEDRNNSASGKAAIEISGKGSGQATALFTGESGIYDIYVNYSDDGDKEARATFGINGEVIDQWSFDADEAITEHRGVGTQISINYGDTITLNGWADDKEKALIDYVEFVSVEDTQEGEEDIASTPSDFRIEAEDVAWGGKAKIKEKDYASGDELQEVEEYAYATTVFTGESGLYDISIGYDDEGKGEAEFTMSHANKTLGYWYLNEGQKDEVNTQTLSTAVYVSNGDSLSFNTGEEKFKIDYIDFTPVYSATNASSNNQTSAPTGDVVLIEAEDIWFNGTGSIMNGSSASGGSYAAINEATGSTLFEGETGYYDIVVSYLDNNDPDARLTIQVNEEQQDQWLTNQTGTNTFVERTVASGIHLTNSSDYLQIIGATNNDSLAYVDYVKLVKVDPSNDTTEVVTTDESTNSDILRGGQGNDTIYGGEGNDVLYGEDEFDSGRLSASNSSDVLIGGEGNDRLYGNSGNDVIYGSDQSDSAPAAKSATLTFEQGVDGYNGAADTILDSYYWNNYGSLTSLYVDARNGYPIQSLLKFDDLFGDQAGQIELDDNITSATIELTVTDAGDSFAVYEMLQGWSESSTWGSMNNGIQTNGYEAKSSAITSTGWVNTGTLTIDVTESLRAWQADPTANQGWAFITEGYNGVKIASTESSDGPRLIVEKGTTTSATDTNDNDQLFGGTGNDQLSGGIGNDRLEGADAIAHGSSEYDILGGGLGSDTFVLGTSAQSYYLGGGDSDYALIQDFDATVDTLELSGSAGNYTQQQQGNQLRLLKGQDLVAVFENTSTLDLNSQSVVFV
ncbi:MAG: NF038122 family metalloprotease [Cyanobacteria bacterium J06621_3]